MREEELGMAAGAVVDVLDLLDACLAQLGFGNRAQVEHAPLGYAVVGSEGFEDLRTDFVTALADAWAERGPCSVDALRRFADQAAGKAAPAAVEHRHRPATRNRDRKAVGHEHERCDAASSRDVAVDLQVAALRIEKGLIRI